MINKFMAFKRHYFWIIKGIYGKYLKNRYFLILINLNSEKLLTTTRKKTKMKPYKSWERKSLYKDFGEYKRRYENRCKQTINIVN